MRITIQTKKEKAIVIDFGYNTPFQRSMYWLFITKEYYDCYGQVEYAEVIFFAFKARKYWKRKYILF